MGYHDCFYMLETIDEIINEHRRIYYRDVVASMDNIIVYICAIIKIELREASI